MKNFFKKIFDGSATFLLRYGLAFVLIWLGVTKLRHFEQNNIHELIENSALLTWMFKYVAISTIVSVVAYGEIICGVLIALKQFSDKLAFWGSLFIVIGCIVSVSFLFTSDLVWHPSFRFPELSKIGQSIIKDLVLLAAAAWCTSDTI